MKKNQFHIAVALMVLLITFNACKEKEKTVYVENVTLDKTSVLLYVGDILALSANVSPFNATDKTLIWNSNDTAIAIMDSNIVTAKKIGKTMITVITRDANHMATCDVTVTMPALPSFLCNGNLPGWGVSLGTVNFASSKTWVITNGSTTQEWSDAVTATACDKTSFNSGGQFDNFSADCRSNPSYPGDLFSWCAIMRFADILCPDFWRIPTAQDFFDLDVILSGTGILRENDFTTLAMYTGSDWGGVYGGMCHPTGELGEQGLRAFYWSQTDHGGDISVRFLSFNTVGQISPAPSGRGRTKNQGLALRCVRDNN